jgi:hypothetical protein
LAALLFVAGAFVMSRSEPRPPGKHPEIVFPHAARPEEIQRVRSRQLLPPPPIVPRPDAGAVAARPRDPVMRALPRAGRTAVVIEANAIRHSALGERLIECLSRQGDDPLRRFQSEFGIDPLTDLDRIAVSEEGLIVSGNLRNARLGALEQEMPSQAYGESGVVYQQPAGTSGRSSREALGRWGDQLFVVGSAEQVQAMLDRVEAPSLDQPPAISEEASYGEIYGTLAVEQLAKMLPAGEAAINDELLRTIRSVELHVDVRDDVAMVLQVTGSDRSQLSELQKAIDGLLAAARVKASTQEDRNLSELLDLAKVSARGDRLDLELALPVQFLERQLAWCRERGDAPPIR